MKKQEVLDLGVPEENYREFQIAYNRDLNSRLERAKAEESPDYATRLAIDAMLKLIKRPETLNSILKYINKAYYTEV